MAKKKAEKPVEKKPEFTGRLTTRGTRVVEMVKDTDGNIVNRAVGRFDSEAEAFDFVKAAQPDQ